ncbi:hypothetical protein AciX8_1950 [Granulicella mallensis MP5ACTX8]|uniref:Uncharacterized protein n=2 Tax=Granulicella mallensis TaxID=940614 RepID=G8NST8_GRAMM|nr:hypothetical protein AciX8_1950 [Granulicella mallensis MP5ACTX8]
MYWQGVPPVFSPGTSESTWLCIHVTEQSLALRFPLRLERAQLVKEEASEAYSRLLVLMAQTARGSWHASPQFGIRDQLEELQKIVARDAETEEQRMKRCEALVADVNAALLDLGLDLYCVDRMEVHFPSRESQGSARAQWVAHLFDDLSALFVIRPTLSKTSGNQEL